MIGFALGAGLFWSVARELARPIRPISGPAVLIAAVLGICAYAPAVALVLSAEPDWAYAYVIAADQLPRWLSPCLVLLAGIGVPAGFAAALRASRGRPAFNQAWFWLPLVLGLGPLLLFARRLGLQATFEQYHGDFGVQLLVGGPLGYLLLWLVLALAGATWLARRCLDFLALGGSDGS